MKRKVICLTIWECYNLITSQTRNIDFLFGISDYFHNIDCLFEIGDYFHNLIFLFGIGAIVSSFFLEFHGTNFLS